MSEHASSRRGCLSGLAAIGVLACRPTAARWDRSAPLRFDRVAELDGLGRPRQILPHGGRALVVTEFGFAVVRRAGAEQHPSEDGVEKIAVAIAGGFLLGTQRFGWNGRMRGELRTGGVLDVQGRRQIALASRGGEWIMVVRTAPGVPNGLAYVRQRASGGEHAPHVVSDEGDAAIAPDGRVVLALASGRVLVLGEPRGPEGAPRVHVDVPIGLEPYAVACDADGILLLAGTRVGAADDGERIAAASSWTPKRAWTCTLVELGFDGRERSRAAVPFAGLQALRRRDGSVVVAGMGVALVDDGTVRWARASSDRVHAAVVGDGIVLAHGTTIERVDAVGRVVATASIEGGPITCLGPIGGDGAIWVATATGVWRSG